MALNINRTAVTNYSDIATHTLTPITLDLPQDLEETKVINERFKTDWTFFNRIPKLKSAIKMKAVWRVGKGYTADTRTEIILDRITGTGKQTFLDIIFTLDVLRMATRDSFAEIIRDEEGNLINLKIISGETMTTVYDDKGIIIRYEQRKLAPKGIIAKTIFATKNLLGKEQGYIKFEPKEILHLPHDNFGETHGRSIPELLEKMILADDENFNIMRKLARFQAVPFIMFKVRTDNATSIAQFKANIKEARESGEDLIIPDDENLLSWEVVQVSPSAILMEWRRNLNNEFYQAVGMPLILFGGAGSTESGGKVEYLGHETVFRHDQLELEKQIEQQLGLTIKFNSPTTLLENLQEDESKDSQNALTFQQSDITANSGR